MIDYSDLYIKGAVLTFMFVYMLHTHRTIMTGEKTERFMISFVAACIWPITLGVMIFSNPNKPIK